MKRLQAPAGFSLVEVVLAIGIVAFAFISLVALLPLGLNAVQESDQESGAVNVLSAVAADIQNIRPGETESPLFHIPVWEEEDEAPPPSGTLSINDPAQGPAARYRLTWTIHQAASGEESPSIIHLAVRWPAQSPSPTGLLEVVMALPNR